MIRRWPARAMIVLLLMSGGCAQPRPRPDYAEVVANLETASRRPPESIRPDEPMAVALDPAPAPGDFTAPQPVEVFVRRALAENRSVQSARYNVLAMKARIPQVTTLDDPQFQGAIFPDPSSGPQSTSGFEPFSQTLTQEFPWFGTLSLRGQAAEQDVRIALFELGSRQLEAVALVKRAYYDLYYYERTDAILRQNRDLAQDIVEIAATRNRAGGSQQDVLRAQVAVTEIDRELVAVRRGLAASRATMARQLHVNPLTRLRTLPEVPVGDMPMRVERLFRVAAAVRPDLQGRLAAVARDERQVELARKRYYPNVRLGVVHNVVTTRGAVDPLADGIDDVGLFVGFNLPIYRRKLDAAVCEAQARTLADARQYDFDRDGAYAEITELHAEAEAQRDQLDLLRNSILPKSELALEVATRDYAGARVDFVSLNSARQDVLRLRVQVARLEADLNRALAALERAVGARASDSHSSTASEAPATAPPPPPVEAVSPFHATTPSSPPVSGERRSPRPD